MPTAVEMESRVRQLIGDGQLREAAAACDELNQQHPEFIPGWVTASTLAMRVNEPVIAVRAIDRALQLSPGQPDMLLRRVHCLKAAGETAAAAETARHIAPHRFETAAAAADCGLVLSQLGMFVEARAQYLGACELQPDDGQHWYNLATVERFLGNLEAAETALDRCLALAPGDADAHLLRAGLRRQTRERNHVDELDHARRNTAAGSRSRVRICYALAKELEDLADYEQAFAILMEGAATRRQLMRYAPANDLAVLERIRTVFKPDLFESPADGHISAEPIFVIGLPRTGTTLVDRILGSHSVVRSAGELRTFAVELVKSCADLGGQAPPTALELVEHSLHIDYAALGEAYVAAARPRGAPTAHFVDKLPLNFLYAGLIHLALPKAKIILLERAPLDACYAMFKTLFGDVYPFSYDLTELANYYVGYRRLVDHWQSVMPGVMHTVRYEDLVQAPRPVIEGLLDYCNLSWEDACLDFEHNPAPTTTASAAQVRSGFSTGSIGNWRNYERQLQPVVDILAAAGVPAAAGEGEHAVGG